MPPARKASKLRSHATIMLSRVARSLYWMSRYIERAENLARLLDVNLQFLLDFQGFEDAAITQHWDSILASSGDEALFNELYKDPDNRNVTRFLAFDLRNPNSILSSVSSARENARMVRDQISSEMWETINELHLYVQSRAKDKIRESTAGEFFTEVKRSANLFEGITASTFSRVDGWEFIEFGKYLERADKTTRILDVKYHILLPDVSDVGGAVDTVQWQAVLRSASALEAYRRFYVREILPWKVAEFLIFSETCPRSVYFCVAQVDEFLRRMVGETGARAKSEAVRASRQLLGELEALTIAEVLKRGLHEFLIETQKALDHIADEVVQTTLFASTDLAPEEQQQQQQQTQQ